MKKIIFAVILALSLSSVKAYAGGITPPENLRLVKIECLEYPKATATFTWDPVAYATSYKFYNKLADGTDTYRSYDDDPKTPGYTFIFNPDLNFYVAVSAINNETDVTPAIPYETEKTEYFLPSSKVLAECAKQSGKIIPTPSIMVTPVITLSAGNQRDIDGTNTKVKEMEKKVNSLEKKLQQTEKKQNMLENLIQKILSFLHINL